MNQEPTPYDLVIADLESKRDQLSNTIEMLKALNSTVPISLPLQAKSQQLSGTTSTDIARDAFFGMTLPEAAKKYLTLVKSTKPNPVLCDALLKGGFKTQSTNFPEVVRSTLGRHPDFVKVSGEWGLSEWYGNRGGGKRTRRSASIEGAQAMEDPEEPETETPSVDSTDGVLKS